MPSQGADMFNVKKYSILLGLMPLIVCPAQAPEPFSSMWTSLGKAVMWSPYLGVKHVLKDLYCKKGKARYESLTGVAVCSVATLAAMHYVKPLESSFISKYTEDMLDRSVNTIFKNVSERGGKALFTGVCMWGMAKSVEGFFAEQNTIISEMRKNNTQLTVEINRTRTDLAQQITTMRTDIIEKLNLNEGQIASLGWQMQQQGQVLDQVHDNTAFVADALRHAQGQRLPLPSSQRALPEPQEPQRSPNFFPEPVVVGDQQPMQIIDLVRQEQQGPTGPTKPSTLARFAAGVISNIFW